MADLSHRQQCRLYYGCYKNSRSIDILQQSKGHIPSVGDRDLQTTVPKPQPRKVCIIRTHHVQARIHINTTAFQSPSPLSEGPKSVRLTHVFASQGPAPISGQPVTGGVVGYQGRDVAVLVTREAHLTTTAGCEVRRQRQRFSAVVQGWNSLEHVEA